MLKLDLHGYIILQCMLTKSYIRKIHIESIIIIYHSMFYLIYICSKYFSQPNSRILTPFSSIFSFLAFSA